ncbi:MAG: DUF1839 family protein [Gaiellaceae bacterium]
MLSLFDTDPAGHVPHAIHAADRAYPETNCYADILIELMHLRGDEPLAALGQSIRTDFEGDQWTFFKPDPRDHEALFGMEIHEMQPYRALPDLAVRQLEVGRTLIVELDSFYLPDTESTAYRTEHVKSSAVIVGIDQGGERLRYLHNRGLYELSGEDYRHVLRLEPLPVEALPPYTELVRFDVGQRLAGDDLRRAAREIFVRHFDRRPATNPFRSFGDSLSAELPSLRAGTHADYHAYAFATVRMAGSAFELCASHIDWLYGDDAAHVCSALHEIVGGTKALSFKLARRREFDSAPIIEQMAASWDEAMLGLAAVSDAARD